VSSGADDDHDDSGGEDDGEVGDDRRGDVQLRPGRSVRVVRVPAAIAKLLEQTHGLTSRDPSALNTTSGRQ